MTSTVTESARQLIEHMRAAEPQMRQLLEHLERAPESELDDIVARTVNQARIAVLVATETVDRANLRLHSAAKLGRTRGGLWRDSASPMRQFDELTQRECGDLIEHLGEQIGAWLFDHDIAGADRAPDWALCQRIGILVRHEHDMARRRARQQTRQRKPRAVPQAPFPDDAA